GNKPKRNPGDFPTTVWQIDVPVLPGVESRHPTEKPLKLFTTPILLHTYPHGFNELREPSPSRTQ
ncbi:MAG TPA: hypothetical protein VN861_01815, partial [Candidatus Acidoferrales bacterium]|nr:hypothetical protein [Candidatus Acidoferrales bacterium]